MRRSCWRIRLSRSGECRRLLTIRLAFAFASRITNWWSSRFPFVKGPACAGHAGPPLAERFAGRVACVLAQWSQSRVASPDADLVGLYMDQIEQVHFGEREVDLLTVRPRRGLASRPRFAHRTQTPVQWLAPGNHRPEASPRSQSPPSVCAIPQLSLSHLPSCATYRFVWLLLWLPQPPEQRPR